MYDALSPSLLSYLHNLRISVDEAEDVVQEVFLRLANHLRKGGEESNLRSWTYQVAHNLAMDIHRTARRNRSNSEVGDEVENELVDPTSDPEQAYLNKEEIKRVQDAMEQLTKQQRNSVLLRAQGLRYAEIASVLRVSEQRALVLVKRALLRLAGGL
jgi:RNA polymerase sigma-70 factor (ECF subfamily)